jgi:hypothetical protein
VIGRACVVLVLALVAGSAGVAQGVTRTDRVVAKVHKAGNDGRYLLYQGTVRSRVFGRGMVVEQIGARLRGKFTIHYRRGTVRGTSVAHAHPRSDGSVDFSGTYTLVSGTGRYRHIRGHGTFSGHGPADFSTATFTQRGRVAY